MSMVSANTNITDDDSHISSCEDTIIEIDQNKSFADLNNEINDDLNKSDIILDDDYINSEGCGFFHFGSTSYIFITRSVTIDGQGHVMDANNSSGIFYINANNVILKNIIFKNSISNAYGAIYCNGTNITVINATFINNMILDSEGVAITCKYDGIIINSTFINNYVYKTDPKNVSAVALNMHNKSISYAINCAEVYDIISFEKNYNVVIINSTVINEATYPIVFNRPYPALDNISSDENNMSKVSNKKIKKVSPKIIAKNKAFKKKTKSKLYSVTLKNNAKPIKHVWITLKIKGKTFKAKTNNKGKATFKITKLNKKGTYKSTIKFKGNKTYKQATKKVIIKLK